MRRLAGATMGAVVLAVCAVPIHAAQVRVQPTDTYGMDHLVLENDVLKVTVNPRQGGRVIDLVDKRTGYHLTDSTTVTAGFAKELVHDDQLPGELMQGAYQAKITERGPQAVTVVTTYRGQTQRTKGVELRKTYRLVEGEPLLRIQYRLRTRHVGVDNMALRLHHVFTPGGKRDAGTARPFIPIPAGPRAAAWDKVYREYTAGWSAVLRKATGDGVVCLFDGAKASKGFNWSAPTIEWFYRPVRLKPGLVWIDEVIVAPTRGLSIVDHADRVGVYQTALAGKQVSVKVYALASGTVAVQPTVIGPDGKARHTGAKRTAKLSAGKVTALVWDAPSADALKGATLRVAVTSGGTTHTFMANPAEVKGFAVPVPKHGPVQLASEPVERVTIARPLDGPEIRGTKPVACEDTGWKPLADKKYVPPAEVQMRDITLDTGVATYGLRVPRFRLGKDKPWKKRGEWCTGLGMPRPSSANFYGGGFFGMAINGRWLRTTAPGMTLVRGVGKAAVDLRWEIDAAVVTMRLLALGGDGALYGQIDLSPKTDVKTVEVRFLAFPGGFHGKRDKRFRTAKKEYGSGKVVALGPEVGWLLQYDRLMNPGSGAVAMVFPPKQIIGVQVDSRNNYSFTTIVSYRPSLRRLHFVLWNMYRSTNERALEQIKSASGPALTRLGTPGRVFAVGHAVQLAPGESPGAKDGELPGGKRGELPGARPAGVRLRILELATFTHGESRWGHRHFDEMERSEFLYTHKWGRPTRYEQFLRQSVESSRYAFRAAGQFAYHLRNRKDVEVHTAYQNLFTDYLARLYDYDLLVVNDFPLELLDPYETDLRDYVASGRGIVFLGGYGAYGGMGAGYGTWKGSRVCSLLPVAIRTVPDFMPQTDYRPGLPDRTFRGRYRECDYPDYRSALARGFYRFGPVLPITRTLGWLGWGARVERAHEAHPIVAGVPLEMLAPDYHRVTARGDGTVVARIGRDPAIAVSGFGKGRVAALTFSDARRFWLWKHTPQLYAQLADWVAGQPARPMVSRMSVGHWGRAVGVELSNPTDRSVKSDLVVTAIGAGARRTEQQQGNVSVPARTSRRVAVRLPGTGAFAPGPIEVVARWAAHTAYAEVVNPAPSVGVTLDVDHEHKRHFIRRETIAPRVIVKGRVPGGATLVAELVGAEGRPVRSSGGKAAAKPGDDHRLPIPAKRLAFGPYGYRVSLRNGTGQEIAAASLRVKVCRLVIPEFPVWWYGYGVHKHGDLDSYLDVALLSRFAEQANAAFAVRGWGSLNLAETSDHALGLGMPLMSYCFYVPGIGGAPGTPARRSPRNPSRLKAIREAGLKQAGFSKHPAVHWFYIDDEGTGFSETDYDKAQYQKETGRPWPKAFTTVGDHYSAAKFHLRGGNLAWKAAFDALREVLPDRSHYFLQTVGNVAANGGWLWDNMRDSAVNCIDLYPPAPSDYGQCLFFFNAMRCLGYHNGHPGWVLMGEYRESFDMMRCQWWLQLGSGLEGYGWYSGCYGGGPNGIGSDRIHRIAPYDRRAMRYGALLARWDKPRSKVAMYWSLASSARRGPTEGRKLIRTEGRKVDKACEATAVDLYRHDLYPDVITEAEVLADKHLRYDAIVLAGVTWDTKQVTDKLAAYARNGRLLVADSSTIRVPGAQPYDGAALARQVKPAAVTPDPLVHAEPVRAGAQRYLIVYNHQDKPVNADVAVAWPDAKVVYDVFNHVRLPVRAEGGTARLKVKLDAYNGVLLALCAGPLPDVRVRAGDARCGTDVAVEISAGVPSGKGMVPVDVVVVDPQGTRTTYGGSFAVTDGRSRYRIPTGVNDLAGRWTVCVTDLITGKTATATFHLTGGAKAVAP